MNLKPEELVKALRSCSDLPTGNSGCAGCMFASLYEPACTDLLLRHAADQIERDQKEIEALRELAVAYKEGRAIILPCKVGHRVFALLDTDKHISECEVKQIGLGNEIGFVGLEPIGARGREYGVALNGFGKTVFLTREEAEKALAEMEGKKDG